MCIRDSYGSARIGPLLILLGTTVIGWGLVTNTFAEWLTWQGFLLEPLGLGGREGAWAFANLGVLVALVLAFVLTLVFCRASVRRQESVSTDTIEAMVGAAK